MEMGDNAERSFIMVKPDGVHRGVVGEIIKRFEQRGYRLVAMKFVWVTPELLKEHYAALSAKPFFNDLVKYMGSGPVVPMASEDHLMKHYAELKDRPFFPKLVKYMSSGPVVPMVWEGKKIVDVGRQMLGATDPLKSNPGTIRGDFGIDVGRNICHGSDSLESASREIKLWFSDQELIAWTPACKDWIYE